MIALAHQFEALQHAEAMLLVHHHQAELREAHVLFDERVRADGQITRRPRRSPLDFRLFRRLARADQQFNAVVERAE